jgi:hypothetical protein
MNIATDPEISRRLTRFVPRSLTAAQWDLAAAVVRAAVISAVPSSAAHAKVLASNLCAFLADSTVWDRSSVPELSALLIEAAISAHVQRQSAAGKRSTANRKRADLRRIARALAGAPPQIVTGHSPRRSGPVDERVAALLSTGVSMAVVVGASTLLMGAPLTIRHLDYAGAELAANAREAGASTLEAGITTITDLCSAPDAPSSEVVVANQSRVPSQIAAARKTSKSLSRAGALRHAKAALAEQQRLSIGPHVVSLPTAGELSEEVVQAIVAYRPQGVADELWLQIVGLCQMLLAAYRPAKRERVSAVGRHLSDFVLWALTYCPHDGVALSVDDLLSAGLPDAWAAHLKLAGVGSVATRRSAIARALKGLQAPETFTSISYVPIQGPYTQAELARFRRLALVQPTPRRSKDLCFVVGLGAGAGLSGSDLRYVRRCDITEVQSSGGGRVLLVAVVGGQRARTVVVREQYVDLVRRACQLHDELVKDPGRAVLGNKLERRNITVSAVNRAVTATHGEKIELNIYRLRSSWLLAMMCAPVPLAVLLEAAGLKSARSLVDLLPYCPPLDQSTARLALARAGLEQLAVTA